MGTEYLALDWLARRHAGESAALIAHHAGVTPAAVQAATRDFGPFPRPTQRRGARPIASEDQVRERVRRWIELRRRGHTTTTIARSEGTSHQMVSRATRDHGPFPAPDVVRRWIAARREGRTLANIGEQFGVPPATIRRATAPSGPFPMPGPQLPDGVFGVATIARRVGVGTVSVLRWRDRGRLPAPDFVTSRGRSLWLPATIERWLATSEDLVTCPACGAQCVSLRHHELAKHPDPTIGGRGGGVVSLEGMASSSLPDGSGPSALV